MKNLMFGHLLNSRVFIFAHQEPIHFYNPLNPIIKQSLYTNFSNSKLENFRTDKIPRTHKTHLLNFCAVSRKKKFFAKPRENLSAGNL